MQSISARWAFCEAITHFVLFEYVFVPKSNVFFFSKLLGLFSYNKDGNNCFFHLRTPFFWWFLPCFDTQLEFGWWDFTQNNQPLLPPGVGCVWRFQLRRTYFFWRFFFLGGGRKGTSMLFGLYWDTCYKTRWWFQIFRYFLFSPLFREDSHFDEYFSNGLVQPPTSRPLGYTELLLQKVKHDFYLPANNPCRMTDLRASINRDLSQNQFFIPNNFQTASPATVCFF